MEYLIAINIGRKQNVRETYRLRQGSYSIGRLSTGILLSLYAYAAGERLTIAGEQVLGR